MRAFVAVLAGAMVALFPGPRRRAQRFAEELGQAAMEQAKLTMESLRPPVETMAQRAGQTLTAPTDLTLALARERLLTGLPQAADTKWRVNNRLLREMITAAVLRDPRDAGALLEAAGQAYAVASRPDGGWSALTIHEAAIRIARALRFDGPVRRRGAAVELVTTACPLVRMVDRAHAPALCEAVCGEQASLLHGLAAGAGRAITSPQRMGNGDPYCVRQLLVTPDVPTRTERSRWRLPW